jgi:NhaP-type Na+/H+ or K+/H+ antiporter
VTGPTVVLPLLRYLRPVGHVGSILKWEGILNDPVGATCAVLVLESILPDHMSHGMLGGVLRTLVLGSLLGYLSTRILVFLMRRYWIPDFLQAAVMLMAVVSAFTWSNMIQEESGLLTVTVMGVVLANQKSVVAKHILEFKENLRVLLISCLFIILAARLELSAFVGVDWWGGFAFLAVLILVVRPLSVFVSTAGTNLTWQEKLFVSWMAPRGIVAAAVASLFSMRLIDMEYPGAEKLVPVTFLVIVGTITVYGLTAYPLGLWAKVTSTKAQGVLLSARTCGHGRLARCSRTRGSRCCSRTRTAAT